MQKPQKLPCEFQIGMHVYHRTPGNPCGIVTSVQFCGDGGLLYHVAFEPGVESSCYGLELSRSKTWPDEPDESLAE